ncbi:hypothetical protein Tco_1465410, partial [Tanacetum coccineum]
KTKGTAVVQLSKINANSELKCVQCNGCMFSDNHDLRVLECVNEINAKTKFKSAKKSSKKKEWKPTGKVFTTIGYIWRPSGRTFTIVGDACPLTRITSTQKVPLKEPIHLEVETLKPVIRLSKLSFGVVDVSLCSVAVLLNVWKDFWVYNCVFLWDQLMLYFKALDFLLLIEGFYQRPPVDLTLSFSKRKGQIHSHCPRGIFINKSKYALESCDPVDTPMVEKSKVVEDPEGKAADPSHYHEMIGTLLYLTASRPDLQFVVCMCARYQARPTEKNLLVVKRIFRYLKGAVNRGLWYPKDSSITLTAFVDDDHVGFQDTRHSTSGSM